MEIIKDFLIDEALIMIPVLYILGEIIKHTDVLASRWIPVLLLFVSIGFTPMLLGGFTPDNIVQAILVAGAPVLADQLVKQAQK